MLIAVGSVLAIAAIALSYLGRRRNAADLGTMSAQWLAEQRAGHSS